MEGAYLPGNIWQRMQELMKEHKITQAQLATRTESAISRFVRGKTDKISTGHLLRIAKVFEVSTDFLLGEVNTPDQTNFDIEELGPVGTGSAESVHWKSQCGDRQPPAGKPALCRSYLHD